MAGAGQEIDRTGGLPTETLFIKDRVNSVTDPWWKGVLGRFSAWLAPLVQLSLLKDDGEAARSSRVKAPQPEKRLTQRITTLLARVPSCGPTGR